MAVSPALVWDQSPLVGQVRTSKNRMTKRRRTAIVGGIAPHTSRTTETDVVTGLTSGARDDSRSVGRGFRVLDAIVELGGAHKGG